MVSVTCEIVQKGVLCFMNAAADLTEGQWVIAEFMNKRLCFSFSRRSTR